MPIALVLCIDRAYFINVIQGRSELPTWSLSLPAVTEKVVKRELPKNSHLWPYMKKKKKWGKRNPKYQIAIMRKALCQALSPAGTFFHAVMMTGRWF